MSNRDNERMLPGDFQKYLKYQNQVKNTEKIISKPKKGFFTFPEELKGNTELPIRPFLVFYFDNQDDYEKVRNFFEKKQSKVKSHPDLDQDLLIELIEKEKPIGSKKEAKSKTRSKKRRKK